MESVRKILDKVLGWFAVILFAVLVVVVVWQVLVRQVITPLSPGFSSPWTDELARVLFVWLGFIATALVFSEKGHIAVDFVVLKFPKAVQKVVAILVQALIILFAVWLMILGGWGAAMNAMGQRLSTMPFLTMGQTYLIIPIAGVIIVIYAIYHMIAVITGKEDAIGGGVDEIEAELARVAADESLAADRAANEALKKDGK